MTLYDNVIVADKLEHWRLEVGHGCYRFEQTGANHSIGENTKHDNHCVFTSSADLRLQALPFGGTPGAPLTS